MQSSMRLWLICAFCGAGLQTLAHAESSVPCTSNNNMSSGCWNADAASSEDMILLQKGKSQRALAQFKIKSKERCETGDNVLCPDGKTMCAGDQCCPRFKGSGTTPCP
eukprot:CAMPEP_0115129564 /NCGR_PEP_ID=MMETSP0227-20121206/51869_1 /TAXON_ID=89957 /ORGANISM="Polarella glacialis, Strain CCMP 1383" /LENGTH=107 /DNA_ID=CAMNT_0002534463 /DNA_START=28 /DNA_END=347 /DNA_ORIENTATION=-